jgi:hypothetical protein
MTGVKENLELKVVLCLGFMLPLGWKKKQLFVVLDFIIVCDSYNNVVYRKKSEVMEQHVSGEKTTSDFFALMYLTQCFIMSLYEIYWCFMT